MTQLAHTFATVLADAHNFEQTSRGTSGLYHRLLLPIAVVAVLLGVWVGTAPLAGAVIAPAEIKVELNRKTIQHQEGGIVRKILVRDGQQVRAGEPLLVIGDLRSNAELNVLQDQLRAERARAARAGAEAALESTFEAPPDAAANGGADYVARESALFTARRRTLYEEIAALEGEGREVHAQAGALQLQVGASDASARLAGDELTRNQNLVPEGYVARARILQLQRAEADARSKLAEARGKLAEARQHGAEIRAKIARARNQYQQQAADELKESTSKLRELQQRLEPSRDQVERQIVRSPVDGEVMALRVAGVGAVIAPREPLLDVVPSRERLVVEAHVRPQDINSVQRNATALVRLTSFDPRTTPLLTGTVSTVSGDRITAADNHEPYFLATVEVDAAALTRHPHIRLQAGMPAELYIATGERSLLEYLLRPLRVFSQRAMREP